MADTAITIQKFPSAALLTDAYTVPGATLTEIRSIVVCNQNTNPDRVRISIAIAGAANSQKQYIVYDYPVAGFFSQGFTLGPFTLNPTDVIRIYSLIGNAAFTIFGMETT